MKISLRKTPLSEAKLISSQAPPGVATFQNRGAAIKAGSDPRHTDLTSLRFHLVWEGARCPGGVLRFELDRGVPLEPQNPYPSLRVILAGKGIHFKGFFLKKRPIFQKFRHFRHAKTRKLGSVRKVDPCFKPFFGKKRESCLRISCKKATH